MHHRANPLPIYFPMSFEGQGHIVEKRTLAYHLYTYPKVYVQSFRSLALILHTDRENLLYVNNILEIQVYQIYIFFTHNYI